MHILTNLYSQRVKKSSCTVCLQCQNLVCIHELCNPLFAPAAYSFAEFEVVLRL